MTRRHTRRWGLSQLGRAGSSPATPFSITSVSQTAGKAAGGTVLTVTAVGISGTPTSTLGTVSAVTGTTFHVTTAVHAAANVSWTATNGNGQVSAAQTYQYLALPLFNSVVPSHGPATVSSSVTCGISNIPPAGTGCPITITIGAGTCTAITPTAPATCTATLGAPGIGAVNCTATVDGVSTGATAGLYSGDAPPVIISVSNVPTTGGSGNITGQNFVAGMTASVSISGTPTALTLSSVTSTSAIFSLPAGTYAASSGSGWPLTVTTPDGQSDTESLFQIVTSLDPQTILGAALLAWVRADSGVTAPGNLVTNWNDKTANGVNFTAATTARPTFNPASANGFNAQPTVTFDGVANILTSVAGPNLGSNTEFIYIVGRLIGSANTGSGIVGVTGGANGIQISGAKLLRAFYSAATPAVAAVAANPSGPFAAYSAIVGTGSTSEVASLNVGNLSEIAGTTGNGFQPASGSPVGPITIGGASGINFTNIEIAEVLVANVKPNATQLNQLYQYLNFRYGLDVALSFTRATSMLASTGSEARIAGAGFNSTTTASVVIAGTPTSVTATYLNAGSVSLSSVPNLAAGQYDVILTNANSGESITINNALNVTATKQPDTIGGRKLVAWARADQITPNGAAIASFTDLACIGNVISGAGAAQPALNSANSNFASQPTATFNGTTSTMTCAAVHYDAGTHDMFAAVVYRTASIAGTQIVLVTPDQLRTTVGGAGKPTARPSGAGTGAAWGSAVSATTAAVYFYNQFVGTNTFNSGINVALLPSGWGTEQTSLSQTGNNANANSPLTVGSVSGLDFFAGDVAEIVMFDQMPTAGQIADLATYFGRY